MNNFIKDNLNTIINGDCLDVMKQIPDKSIDLVLTDPPYGIIKDIELKGMEETSKAKNWDDKIPEKIYFDEIFRISKNQIIWGYQYFVNYFDETTGIIFWDKKNGENFMSDGELAYNSCTQAVRIFRYAKIGKDNFEPIRYHPTQKPLKLFEWVLRKYSKEGQTVLDCFSGSGTTAIACHNLHRNFICIEKDVDYYKASVERLNNAQAQLKLF